MTIGQEIQTITRKYHAVHRTVLIYYLCKYFSIPMSTADKAIHKAAIARYCYELDNGFVSATYQYKVDTNTERVSKALRVAFEFMGTGERTFLSTRLIQGNDANTIFMLQQSPSEEHLKEHPNAESQLIQISYILRGNEEAISHMLASKPVASSLKKILCRIAIIEESTDTSKIEKAGYRMFIRFKKGMYTFKPEDIQYTDKETRWDDVQII